VDQLSAEKRRHRNRKSDTQCKYPAMPNVNEEYRNNTQSNASKEYVEAILLKCSMSFLLNLS